MPALTQCKALSGEAARGERGRSYSHLKTNATKSPNSLFGLSEESVLDHHYSLNESGGCVAFVFRCGQEFPRSSLASRDKGVWAEMTRFVLDSITRLSLSPAAAHGFVEGDDLGKPRLLGGDAGIAGDVYDLRS